jgi:hypothetical protein
MDLDSDGSSDDHPFALGMPGTQGMQGLSSLFGGGTRGPRRRRQQAAAPVFGQIPDGAQVRLKRLKTSAQVNDATAKVLNFDPERQRYLVKMSDARHAGAMALKGDNLVQMVQGVQLHGLRGCPELNGAFASLMDIDDESGRTRCSCHRLMVAAGAACCAFRNAM